MVKFLKSIAGKAKDAVTDGAETSWDFLSGPFKTDELMAKLEQSRTELSLANEALAEQERVRDEVAMDLRAMGAKAIVLNALMTEVVLFAPPEPGPAELDHLRRTEKIYDPLEVAYLVAGSAALATMLPKLGAGAIRMLSMGKFLKNAKNAKLITGAAKLGKATVVLAVAIFLVDTLIKMIHARKVNEEIAAARAKLREEIVKANREIARVSLEREEAVALKDAMLADAGVETVQAFLVEMNQAIADVSAEGALVKVARNLLRIGQPMAVVRQIVQVDEVVIERVARRLAIEQALIDGQSVGQVADETGADPAEITLVRRLLAVRGDAARGFDDAELVARYQVVDAVADIQIEIATTALTGQWEALLQADRLDAIARETLIPEDALLLLVPEVAARAALWSGASPETVIDEHPDVPRSRILAMGDALTAEKATAAETDLEPLDLAVRLRLPLAALAA